MNEPNEQREQQDGGSEDLQKRRRRRGRRRWKNRGGSSSSGSPEESQPGALENQSSDEDPETPGGQEAEGQIQQGEVAVQEVQEETAETISPAVWEIPQDRPEGFGYRKGQLYCEAVAITPILERVGTPTYIYSYHLLMSRYQRFFEAFQELNPLICYSMKANGSLAVLKALTDTGAGLDIVSGGELYKAQRVGLEGDRIVFAGVGKTAAEIEEALHAKILLFNVESIEELQLINQVAGKMRVKASVSLRINPDVQPGTHNYMTTGKAGTKFGLDLQTVQDLFQYRDQYANIKFSGVHLHIGSQITQIQPFADALQKVVPLIQQCKEQGHPLEWVNLGGGLGIDYRDGAEGSPEELAQAVIPILKELGVKLILEPGRFIVGPAGVLAGKILYVKETPAKKFVITDIGMNDLMRPALYQAYHRITPVKQPPEEAMQLQIADVVGPVCETGDFVAQDREMAPVAAGDFLVVSEAGAYGFSMASNYNARLRPAEVFVIGDHYYIVREREEYPDLIKGESIPLELT
ncbi:MAG: diaminopimelate decarboxylase [Candidatus Omnitrophica bacterium]|nr:diaminopimelate decarboxylase [Candidatus Omnitrophota bacterium]